MPNILWYVADTKTDTIICNELTGKPLTFITGIEARQFLALYKKYWQTIGRSPKVKSTKTPEMIHYLINSTNVANGFGDIPSVGFSVNVNSSRFCNSY